MAKVLDHRSKAARPVPVWFYRIYHNVVNRFYIVPIPILKCLQSQCLATQALLVKGEFFKTVYVFKKKSFYVDIRVDFLEFSKF